MADAGIVYTRTDAATPEILFGLMGRGPFDPDADIEVDPIPWLELVSPADVIRVGLGAEPADFPATALPDIERAIAAAVAWVADYVENGAGIA